MFFLSWTKLQNDDVVPGANAVFDIERSYWTARRRCNLLMVHDNERSPAIDALRG